jgi:lambda repressor-like predicted transcriptional regulator
MATSAGLAWSLNNGISQAQYDQSIADAYAQAQAKGLTDAQIESNMNQYGVSAADLARATNLSEASLQARLDAATPTTAAEIAYDRAAMAELATRQGSNQQQIAANEKAYQEYLRLNEIKNQQQIAANLALSNEQKRLNEIKNQQQIGSNQKAYEEYLRLNEAKNQQQIAANLALSNEQKRLNEIKNQQQISANLALSNEQKRLNEIRNQEQIATNQRAYEAYLANQQKLAGLQAGTGLLEQNFRNYQSIAPGAQYDPSLTGGMSPYSKVMGQMSPLTNPYAGMAINQPMGGYNPGLYDQIAAVNTAKAAADTAAATATAAQQLDASSTGGMAQGGMVHGGLMFGMNPPGPDDGAVNLDMGEYVIKKSSVDKYGRGLLDMINEGKVPAKKLKSLLG